MATKTQHPSMGERYPNLAAEFSKDNAKSFNQYTHGSEYKAKWDCSKDPRHTWTTAILNRTIKGSGCHYCSGKKPFVGVNDLATLHPALASEWSKRNKKSPEEYRESSNLKVWWECSLGHEWEAHIHNRTRKGTGCPYCGRRLIMSSKELLSTLYPELADEWGDRNSTIDFDNREDYKLWWKCPTGLHEFQCTLHQRRKSQGCGVCAGRVLIQGYNDFATNYPELAKEWSPRNAKDASEVVSWSDTSVQWVCSSCSHEWSTHTANRVSRGTGCPACARGNSSKVESHLLDKLKVYGDVEGQANTTSRWSSGRIMKVDILFNEKICVDYDGGYWHADRVENDTTKTEKLLADGYYVIRVRDSIGPLEIDHPNLLQVNVTYSTNPSHLDSAVQTIHAWMIGNQLLSIS